MPTSAPPASSRKVLLIGWDAADWKVINPILDAGKMPNLAHFIDHGVMGNIATLQPALSPMLWTSIATGKRPYKHGIYGFTEPDPVSGGIRPVTNLSRRTKAIWNLLNQTNHNTITVGWWPSNPAEPLSKGIMVSNGFQQAHGPAEPWPLKPEMVHPERLRGRMAELRFHPSELTETDLRPFLPGLDGMTAGELLAVQEHPLIQVLMKIIADCTSVHSVATALMQNEPWDLMCVYQDAVDHFGHAFMKYHPPKRNEADDWEYRVFNHCIEACYRFHDMMLGTLLQLAGDDTTVILMSDHGFHPDDLRLSTPPREPAGPAAEHRQFGIFAARGPDLRKDARIHGAGLLDICPTLLHLFGLPVGEDMDGKVLMDIYDPEICPLRPIERIPSWDHVPGDDGMHPPDRQISPADSKAALDQLEALGYIETPDEDRAQAMDVTVRELDYNLAQSYVDGGIYTEAVTILERLYAKWPMEHRFGFRLAICYQCQGRPAELRALVKTVSERRMEEARAAKDELEKVIPQTEEAALAEAHRIAALDGTARNQFFRKRRELFAKSRPNLCTLSYLEACADFSERNFPAALAKLEVLDSEYGARLNALQLRGEILQRMQRWQEASAAFEEALSIDRESPGPLLGMARTALARHRFPEAVEFTLRSLGLLYFQPRAHYLLGVAYLRMGHLDEAESAIRVCVTQAPLFAAGLRILAQIARLRGADAIEQSQWHLRIRYARQRLAELRQCSSPSTHEKRAESAEVSLAQKPPMPELIPLPRAIMHIPPEKIITVVTGLPRTGTSLMMQVLEAAGIPPFTDGKRQPDASNERGYYEHEKVAALHSSSDPSWLLGACGHSIKVVAPLLSLLPMKVPAMEEKFTYRVLFMERDISEILDSQSAMLTRMGKSTTSQADISKAFHQQVLHAKQWIIREGIPAMSVSHAALVHDPAGILQAIAGFLDVSRHLPAMKDVIDPKLHRSRHA